MEQKKYKTDVGTLSKVFQSLEGMNFDELPVFDENDKFEDQFISTLILTLGNTPAKLNDMFISISISISGEGGKNFMEKDFEELCQIAQGFFDNTPSRFKDTVRTLIDGQRKQRNLAMSQMQVGMKELMTNIQKEVTAETHIPDMKSVLENLDLTQKP